MIIAALGLLVGLVLGSFVKAASDRVIVNKSLWGRSYCLSCKHKLAWYDLLPLFSYLFLRGKCRYCQKNIPLGNLLTEIVFGLVSAWLFYNLVTPGGDWLFLSLELTFKLFVIAVLVIVFLVDLKTGLIPDKITYPAIAVSLGYLLFSTGLKSWFYYQGLIAEPLGKYLSPPYSNYVYEYVGRLWVPVGWTILATLFVTLIFALLIIVTRGKGMGWGDVKYVPFLGLALGFPNIIVGVFLAFLIGAIFSLLLIALKKKHFGQTIPFGPFLSLGSLIALFFGSEIIEWYFNSLHF